MWWTESPKLSSRESTLSRLFPSLTKDVSRRKIEEKAEGKSDAMTYVTFFSHYGAIQFKKQMEARGLSATLMPVPRFLSSSCGTCARLEGPLPADFPTEEIEGVYLL